MFLILHLFFVLFCCHEIFVWGRSGSILGQRTKLPMHQVQGVSESVCDDGMRCVMVTVGKQNGTSGIFIVPVTSKTYL